MMMSFMDEAFEHIKEQLDKSGHEIIFRYDCRKRLWLVHLYPTDKSARYGFDRSFMAESMTDAVINLMGVFRDMKKGR